ncbi:hypothetical protein [Phenylobacterium sp.]|uniref:hypothetical protein n=1 Tax=Phenylobacterium sp. TaxID=1871053 RepID=UPI0035B031B0
MVRFIALAAVSAAALIAAPASAQEISQTVAVAGKSQAQIQADVVAAAEKVCRQATAGETFRLTAYNACVGATVADAMKRI